MHLKRCGPSKSKNKHVYWELVESYRSERGPRQRVVAYLGNISRSEGESIKQAAEGKNGASGKVAFLMRKVSRSGPRVDAKRVKVGRVRDFGGYWLGLQILREAGTRCTFLREEHYPKDWKK